MKFAPLAAALGLLLCPSALFGQTTPPAPLRDPETPEQRDARMAWWREGKFGMFIHWGLYAIPADGEWHMRKNKMPLAEYQKFAAEFNPEKFNADEWGALARDAGMKYMVLTTKHHDGFALFHSAASAYNITDATPFKRDPLKELSLALPKYGVKLGAYYSILADWGHPGGEAGEPHWDKAQDGDFDAYLNQTAIPQVKELLTNYGPVSVLWFDNDGSAAATPAQVARIAEAVKLQPQIIVTPRLLGYPGDFQTCEGHIPMQAPRTDWELCTRANGSWGYTGAPARPLKDLLAELTEAWGKGGNVLLNVGPTREGIIPADSAARLREIGAWLKINGEAIYGSVRGPFDYLPWGWATRKGNTLYLHVLQWPADGQLRLPNNILVERAWLLADPAKDIAAKIDNGRTVLTLPATAPDPVASVVAVKFKSPITPVRSLILNKPITASENQNSAKNTVNGGAGGDWRIKSDTGVLTVDMGQPQTFSVLRLTAPYTAAKKILLEIQDGAEWKPAYTNDAPKGTEWTVTFPPVTAQTVRLTITAEKPELRVSVFELFPPL